jgi:hypothetical protein
MKIRTSIAAAGTAVILGCAGGLALPAVASAHSATHTLKFSSMTAKSVGFTQTAGAQQDTDVNSAGKTIGFDDLYITFTGKNTAAAGVALDIKGGFLYGTIATTNAGKTWHGKVTGGPGRSPERSAQSPLTPSPAIRRRSPLPTPPMGTAASKGRDGHGKTAPPLPGQDQYPN